MSNHPITPTSKLIEQWVETWITAREKQPPFDYFLATQAARWGADQELEACKQVIMEQQWFVAPGFRLDQLHNTRRPEPSSLKKQAIHILKHKRANQVFSGEEQETIRRALEQLPDE